MFLRNILGCKPKQVRSGISSFLDFFAEIVLGNSWLFEAPILFLILSITVL